MLTDFCPWMFVAIIHSPNSRAGAEVKHSVGRSISLCRGRKTKHAAKGAKEKMMLQICET